MITGFFMTLNIPEEDFVDFLVYAKRNAYAAEEVKHRVHPALPGSRQYEIRDGAFFYLDIYFGITYFTGQETVYHKSKPIWGMSYAGGVSDDFPDAEAGRIFNFLKESLRAVSMGLPYRGPASFENDIYRYTNNVVGKVRRFSGTETIFCEGHSVYQLHYSGGFLR